MDPLSKDDIDELHSLRNCACHSTKCLCPKTNLHMHRMLNHCVGTDKDKRIRISGFKCLIRVFPSDLSVVQGLCEV